MIPNDDEFDVYVNEGVLVEVWRGEHATVAQQFGADWQGPTHSFLHLAIPQPASRPAGGQAVAAPSWRSRVWRVLVSLGWAWLVWASTLGGALAYGMARGWW